MARVKPVTIPFFISHQGCPHTCVFCDQRTISGSSGELPGAEQICGRIDRWQATAAGRQLEVAFFGGTFTALPMKMQEDLLVPLQPYLKSGTITSVRISTRPDYIESAHLAWLSKMGVRTIELGVQSLDNSVLAASGRGHSATDSLNAIECIKTCGLAVGVQLMPGLPGDTPRTSFESLEQALAAGADFFRFYPTVVLRGTELGQRYAAGEFHPLSLERGVTLCKILLQHTMRSNVPVIRIGLQADPSLDSITILAGCWHPALGQLVRSQLYADLIDQAVASGRGEITVRCHSSRYSDVAGMKRSTVENLQGRGIRMQVVSDNSMLPEQLRVIMENRAVTYSIVTDLNYSIDEV